ncbi:MAG: ATP-dependent zinc metalloprotease FtsH [Caldilineaceae bacterium]|nr:ATP-dependent zinc metalloprotease FtsH [Caldilineaceae bacterium]MBP8109531.1 ATP-dependent zinc metalloprotease FtsH [Caldilineaceae bacterium]MBP8124749.1 ATP-dependent zinc metalloprotease FtsH [Caldilineaceae bacterium]MBP9074542.1 ATP-dependent zinc metalloprotease FtsH [Caldilineaceae bacterium]
MNRSWVWILIAVLMLVGFRYFAQGTTETGSEVGINLVAQHIQKGSVRTLAVQGEEVFVTLNDGTELRSRKETDTGMLETLGRFGVTDQQLSKVTIDVRTPSSTNTIFGWLIMLLPMILIFGFFLVIMRQAGGAGPNRAMQFGRTKARKMDEADRPSISFDDVAGLEEAKQELEEVVEFLKEPEKFAALGARIPKGVLMIGSPGTGKTLLAKAVAGEAGVPFFSASGSEFVEMFVGVGASRVRDLFEQAKKAAPCIIFVDEIDAVGRHRGAGMGGGNDEREQTLNQILVEMDGFDSETNVIVIAATNRPDILDPALLRPGRFDRKVVVDRPDRKGREAILNVHARGKPMSADVDLAVIAGQTPGMVGADLENLLNESAILAARRNKRAIGMDEMMESIERIIAGPTRKSRILSDDERRVVAFHEAGHAIVMSKLSHTQAVNKISIVSRGQALGYVLPIPEEERTLDSRAQLEAEIAGLLGGRAAEQIIFDEVTNGASSDLERVTRLAKAMVTRYGMSDLLGPVQLNSGDHNPFMGMEIGEQRSYSEDMARSIDREVRRIVDAAYDRSLTVLRENIDKLHILAETLLETEVLDRKDYEKLLGFA